MFKSVKGIAVFAACCIGALVLVGCAGAPADTIPKKLLVANYSIASTGEAATSLLESDVIGAPAAERILLAGEAALAATRAARAAHEACDVVDAAPEASELIDDSTLQDAMRECDGLTRAMAAVESSLNSYRALVGGAQL